MLRSLSVGLVAILAVALQPAAAGAQAATKDPECVGSCGEDLNFCNGAAEGLRESCKDDCPAMLPGCKSDCDRMYEDQIERCLSENKDCIASCPDRTDAAKSVEPVPEATSRCDKSIGPDCADGCAAQCETDDAAAWAKCTEECIKDCQANDPPDVPEPPAPSPAD